MSHATTELFLYNRCILADDIVAESSTALSHVHPVACVELHPDQMLLSGGITGNPAPAYSRATTLFRSLSGAYLLSDNFPLRDVSLYCELLSLSAWRMLTLSGSYSSLQNVNWSYFIQAGIQAEGLGVGGQTAVSLYSKLRFLFEHARNGKSVICVKMCDVNNTCVSWPLTLTYSIVCCCLSNYTVICVFALVGCFVCQQNYTKTTERMRRGPRRSPLKFEVDPVKWEDPGTFLITFFKIAR